MQHKTGIEQAIEKFENSPTKLANAIDGVKVSRQNIEHWLKTGRVPSHVAPNVQAATGISVDDLCPGVSWEIVRGSVYQKSASVQEQAA